MGGKQSDSSRLTGTRPLSFYNWPQSFHCCSQASSAHWARYVARTTCLVQDILESLLVWDFHVCCRCNQPVCRSGKVTLTEEKLFNLWIFMACRSYEKYMTTVLSKQVRDISAELIWEDDVQVLSGLDISECLVEFILGHLDVFFYLTLNKF